MQNTSNTTKATKATAKATATQASTTPVVDTPVVAQAVVDTPLVDTPVVAQAVVEPATATPVAASPFATMFTELANTNMVFGDAVASTKKYTVAGVSTLPGGGETKVRLANNLKERNAILRRNGHTNVKLVQLSYAMTEPEATQYLLTVDFGDDMLNSVVKQHAAKLGVTAK